MNPITELILRFQELVSQVPELVQPLIVFVAALVPFIEGEGAAGIGIVGGINPVAAAVAGIVGNVAIVTVVVLVASRVRAATVARLAQRARVPSGAPASADAQLASAEMASGSDESKGRRRFRTWVERFGVPGASLLGPLAIPTHFTAAMLIGMGARRNWVLLWQGIAIVLWTVLITLLITGVISFVTR